MEKTIRKRTEEWEKAHLVPYASLSKNTKGRRHKEEEDETRTSFQRDRDRIIHASAFRRLEYKTQVFVYHEGDYFRNRLTHTIEVSQIARTIARALGVNEDLTEAVALAHDLGHSPFGHSGEKTLNEFLHDVGGFNHNIHSLKIVDELEKKYPKFNGLNLTFEVREGIAKHTTDYDHVGPSEFSDHEFPSIEGQIVDIADEIAYNSHDIDDGLASKMLNVNDLMTVQLWEEIYSEIKSKYPNEDSKVHRLVSVSKLIGKQVRDVIKETHRNIEKFNIKTVDDARDAQNKVTLFGAEMQKMNEELKKFLMEKLYLHYRVVRMSVKAKRILEDLFNTYLNIPQQLPPTVYDSFIKSGQDKRIISDYLAGMTDKFAIDEHNKLFDPYERV